MSKKSIIITAAVLSISITGVAIFAGTNNNNKKEKTVTTAGISSVIEQIDVSNIDLTKDNTKIVVKTVEDSSNSEGGDENTTEKVNFLEVKSGNPDSEDGDISIDKRELSLVSAADIESLALTDVAKADSENSDGVNNENTEESEENSAADVVIEGYTNLGVANVDNYLNVRDQASEEGEILGKLPVSAGCEILSEENGWYYIQSGPLTGYVSAEYLFTGDAAKEAAKSAMTLVAKVNADMLMVREGESTETKILTYVANGEELEVVENNGEWIKINIDDESGYVKAEFVDIYNTLPKGITVEELKEEDGYESTAVELVEYAKQFLGNPYVWGGTSLTNGCDCSGFTMGVYSHFGYSLSRTSGAQSHNGTRVSLDSLQPGDLLFYSYGGSIGHVAIYIGNGQIIHASTERTGIIISNAFYTTPTCATRIIN